MASYDDAVILEGVPRVALMERPVNKLVTQKEKTGKARKSAATISGVLPRKMDMGPVEAGKAVVKIRAEKRRKPLVVVAEALETKNKGSGSREALVETGKDAVAVDEKQTERSWKFINFDDLPSRDMGEEVRKEVAELQEEITQIWRDWVDAAHRDGIEFVDPSDPACLVP